LHGAHTAAFFCDVEDLKAALDEGADVNSRDAVRPPDALAHVLRLERPLACPTPVALLASPLKPRVSTIRASFAPSQNGMTPLLWASNKGNVDVASMLLGRGADTSCRNADGWTALHWACHSGHLAVVEALLQAGTDPSAANKARPDTGKAAREKTIEAA
jgi:ankyrin repeat protein